MNNLKQILLAVLLVVSMGAGAQSNFAAHRFNINFPFEPQFSADTSSLGDAPVPTYSWTLEVADTLHPNSFYAVSATEYPSDYIHSDSLFAVVEGFINSSQNSMFEDEDFTNLTVEFVERNGYPGKCFKWKSNNSNIYLEFYVFLIENRLFELSVVSRDGQHHNKQIAAFFDSFAPVGIPKGSYVLPQLLAKRTLSIDFPAAPTVQTKTFDSEWGKLTLDVRTLETQLDEQQIVYIAMETQYTSAPVDVSDPYALNVFYKARIDNSLASISGDLVSLHDIYYQKNLGKEYRSYCYKGQLMAVYRAYLIGDRMYCFGVLTTPDNLKNKSVQKFLSSFQVAK
jgi:hypothetical protein